MINLLFCKNAVQRYVFFPIPQNILTDFITFTTWK